MFASLIAVIAISVSQINNAEATNWNGHVWDNPTVLYECIDVSTISRTSHVNPCGDINTASNLWELSGSNLTFTGVTSGSYDVSVYAWSSGVSGAGTTVTTMNGNNQIIYAYIAMNKNLYWEDSNVDTSTNGYDWITATGHEFGHAAGVAHYTNPYYIMYPTLGQNDENRYLTSHTQSHITENY